MDFDVDDLDSLAEYLRLNNISKDDICLVGSTTLSLIGIRMHNDIDIIVHSKYETPPIKHKTIEKVVSPWSTLFSDDNLIDNSVLHILHGGFKFVIPELIYHKKKWHNRIKDQSDIIDLEEYARMNDDWNWRLIEDALPQPFLLKMILRKLINRLHLYNQKIRDYFRYDSNLHSESFQMIPTASLLAKQVVDNSFNRYDVIVRFILIDSFLNDKIDGVNLYEKMQERRIPSSNERCLQVFQELIKSFQDRGANSENPILVNKDLHIVDGAHRLACALYFNIPFITIKVNKKLDFSPYGIDWFERNNFSNEELDIINQQKKEIFSNNYLYFEIVLWPPVAQYFNEIEAMIKEKYIVQSSQDNKDISNFSSYVKKLYEMDDIKDWKVNLKIKAMSNYQKDIRILQIEILEPEFRRKSNGKLISKKVEALKHEIRSKYKLKITNYIHDIIVHIGDNYSHTRQSKNLLK